MAEKLAINGGKRLIPEGTIKKWPPVDETDKKMVLDSLMGPTMPLVELWSFQEEFAAGTATNTPSQPILGQQHCICLVPAIAEQAMRLLSLRIHGLFCNLCDAAQLHSGFCRYRF